MRNFVSITAALSLSVLSWSCRTPNSGSKPASSRSSLEDGRVIVESPRVIVESPHDWKPLPDIPLGKFLGKYEGKNPGFLGKRCTVTVQVATYGTKWHKAVVPALYFETRLQDEIYQDWLIPLTYTQSRDDASLSPLAAALKKSTESGSADFQAQNRYGEYKGEPMDQDYGWMTATWDDQGFKSIQSRYNYADDKFAALDDCQNLKKVESYTVDQTDHPEL